MNPLLIERLKREIENFEMPIEETHVGRVVRVGDGIAEIEGLTGAQMSEVVVFDDVEGKTLEEATRSNDPVIG